MPYQIFQKGEFIDGHYLVLEHRRGGLSDVYLTFDLHPSEYNCLALKTLRMTEGWRGRAREMLHQEAAAWVSLGAHPNIVRCFVANDINEIPYLVLEWVADEESNTRSLRNVMVEYGVIDHTAALRLAGDLCSALLHCQSRLPGFAHGDIKPENVLLGEYSTFKLTDFGLARTAFSIRAHKEAAEGQAPGTPYYMAPELWLGQMPDERTDIYAIGCLLYEVFEGERPFAGQTISSIRRSHLEMDPAPPALMTKPVWDMVRICLAKGAVERPANYKELAERVGAMRGRGGQAEPPTSRQPELTATDYGNQALTLVQTGNSEEAFQAFEKALTLDPNLSRAGSVLMKSC